MAHERLVQNQSHQQVRKRKQFNFTRFSLARAGQQQQVVGDALCKQERAGERGGEAAVAGRRCRTQRQGTCMCSVHVCIFVDALRMGISISITRIITHIIRYSHMIALTSIMYMCDSHIIM